LLVGCTSTPKSSADETPDSETDSLVSEISVDDSEGANTKYFYVAESLQDKMIRLFGKDDSLIQVLKAVYSPDQFRNLPEGDDYEPAYTLQAIELLEGDYTTTEGKCQPKTALLIRRTTSYEEEEYFDLHFIEKPNGNLTSSRIELDVSFAQTSASVNFLNDYQLGEGCTTLAIEQSAEGGDIDLHRDRSITFFLADENYFHSVL
jgi:hypothetical protein